MNTSLLFLVFNRPNATSQVLDAIRKAAPKRLYVAADGLRAGHPHDEGLVRQVREVVTAGIDWDCELFTLFRAQNLGCKMAVSSAIDWFFDHEEQGIILEDDCLPHPSFFTYCEELLSRYAHDKRIWHIGANNYQDGLWRGDGDYYFSRHNQIWGWATWHDRWQHYDPDMLGLDEFLHNGSMKTIFASEGHRALWRRQLKWIMEGLDTWDIQWQYTIWKHDGLAIAPNRNLVSNIGFGKDATHTPDALSVLANRDVYELTVQRHPTIIQADMEADEYEYLTYRKRPHLIKRVWYHVCRLLQMLNLRTKK